MQDWPAHLSLHASMSDCFTCDMQQPLMYRSLTNTRSFRSASTNLRRDCLRKEPPILPMMLAGFGADAHICPICHRQAVEIWTITSVTPIHADRDTLKTNKKNQELEQSQVFVVLCQVWPRCCARNGELKSVVCLGRSSRLRSCSVVFSLMQVRVTFKQGGRVATGTGSCATEAQRHEKDKTWALLGKRCPASPLSWTVR